jgi:hypothetical protein
MPGLGRVGGLGLLPPCRDFHLTDSRIIDPFVHKTCSLHPPFFGGKVCGPKGVGPNAEILYWGVSL